jgi:hypothetical protein
MRATGIARSTDESDWTVGRAGLCVPGERLSAAIGPVVGVVWRGGRGSVVGGGSCPTVTGAGDTAAGSTLRCTTIVGVGLPAAGAAAGVFCNGGWRAMSGA